ncbi:MAG TPA: EAL domain-containing protein, partial [Rhodospirillaceae bacterium]|nr:EAL domain-containing protein [Rhodospirillaceae bacterium]
EPLAQYPVIRFTRSDLAPLLANGPEGEVQATAGGRFLVTALPYHDGLRIAVAIDREAAMAGTVEQLLQALLPRLGIVLVASALGTLIGLRLLRKLDEKTGQLVLAGSVLANAAEAYAITDDGGTVVTVNPAFSDITGYSAAEAEGASLRALLTAKEDEAHFRDIWRELCEQGKWQGEARHQRKDGESFLAWQTMTVVHAQEATRVVCLFSDITDLRRKEEHIRHQAFHDGLTGLPNRLLIQDRLAHSIELSRRQGDRLALMFLDLDRFKVINDSLGHDVGDAILIEVAARLGRCLRRSDSIARIGGDEFVVLQPDVANPNEAVEVAEKILAAITPSFDVAGQEIRIGISIGIAMFPVDGEEVGTLMKNADTALYEAKAAGRNTFRFFLQSMNAEAKSRLEMEAALQYALERAEFELFFQPKVTLESLGLEGVEALIRWRRPNHGLVPPLQFIALAEETGLIGRIGDWVLEEACRQIAEWRACGRDIKVAINVSARQFQDPKFADRVADTIAKRDIPPSLLEIEVTESVVMTAPEKAIGQLTRLRAMGLGVAVDDFGTGYSSLSYLKRLPLTCIKIDRAFVRGIDGDRENAAIVAAIIGVGRALGASIVAEGAETAAEVDHLRRAGCPTVQGFFFARPMPAADLLVWLAQATRLSDPVWP